MNPSLKRITPVAGRTVYEDDGRTTLPANGKDAIPTPFWLRRKAEGAVTIEDVPVRTAKARTGDKP